MPYKPKRVGEVINEIFHGRGVENKAKKYGIWSKWDLIVGKGISEKCKPISIKGKTLVLWVEDPIWSQQLSFLKNDMIEKINKELGGRLITRLFFRQGPLPQESRGTSSIKKWSRAVIPPVTLESIERSTGDIKDKDLKRLLRGIFIKSAKLYATKAPRHEEQKTD